MYYIVCIGQFVDGLGKEAPGPWDIRCNPIQMFTNELHHLEVPHTSNIVGSITYTPNTVV
jgi:hypothetical protein